MMRISLKRYIAAMALAAVAIGGVVLVGEASMDEASSTAAGCKVGLRATSACI